MPANNASSASRVRLRLAAALIAVAVAVVAGGAGAEVPAWAQACMETTENPWIRSGYCEAHDAWTRYYCRCEYTPTYDWENPFDGGGNRGRRGGADDVAPR